LIKDWLKLSLGAGAQSEVDSLASGNYALYKNCLKPFLGAGAYIEVDRLASGIHVDPLGGSIWEPIFPKTKKVSFSLSKLTSTGRFGPMAFF
jgi:hypothetical protein